jgi:hypothetical protein
VVRGRGQRCGAYLPAICRADGGAHGLLGVGAHLRRLEGLETAYRVTYRRFGQVVTEDHDALDALRTLLAAQGANLTVTRIETTDLGGRTKAVLLAPVS